MLLCWRDVVLILPGYSKPLWYADTPARAPIYITVRSPTSALPTTPSFLRNTPTDSANSLYQLASGTNKNVISEIQPARFVFGTNSESIPLSEEERNSQKKKYLFEESYFSAVFLANYS